MLLRDGPKNESSFVLVMDIRCPPNYTRKFIMLSKTSSSYMSLLASDTNAHNGLEKYLVSF